MSYSKKEQGQTINFETEPDGEIPFPITLLVLGTLSGIPILLVSPTGFFVVFLLFLLIALFMKFSSKKSTKFRSSSKFSVNTDGIAINDTHINRKDVHRVIIRNHVLSDKDESAVICEYGSMAGAGNAAGSAYDKKRAAISYRIEVEAGGKATCLAGGLNETTAFAVLSDVSKVLGLKVSQSNN